MPIVKIISGAQTGADRAGLQAALDLGLDVGGWIPLGRRTDEGRLSDADFLRFKLREHPSSGYPGRTEQNAREADATLWFGKETSPGGLCTAKACVRHRKPFEVIRLAHDISRFLLLHPSVAVINVAGNRERTNPGIYERTYRILIEALSLEVLE